MAERDRLASAPADPPPMPWLPQVPLGAPIDPALGGPLLVRAAGPGAVDVATDQLAAHAERLSALSVELEAAAGSLGRLPMPAADLLAIAPPAAGRSIGEVAAAHLLVRAAGRAAAEADDALTRAIARYGEAEEEQRARAIRLGEVIGTLAGPAIRTLLLFGLPGVLAATAAGFPTRSQLGDLRRWMLDHPELITSPAFVETVRAVAMSMDEAAGSVAGLPPGAAPVLAAAAGFTGVEAGAAYLLAGARPFGLFRDGPVRIDQVSTTSEDRGPRGSTERLSRVPEDEQVRIERYDAPGEQPRYVVYVGPTETFSPLAEDEPWDLTSNVIGVAGMSAGSIRATEAAMHDAGITGSDEVQLVGFSQGGLVAARIAASGEWNVAGLETYGAPAGNIVLPPGLAGMAVRNSDDFVPALAGPQLDHHLLQVERQAFAPGSPLPTELPAPAHQRSAYVATASEIDRAASTAVRQQIAAMDAFTSDYTRREDSSVTVLMYRGFRGAAKAAGGHGTTSSGAAIP